MQTWMNVFQVSIATKVRHLALSLPNDRRVLKFSRLDIMTVKLLIVSKRN